MTTPLPAGACCPQCGSPLLLSRRVILREEHEVLTTELDQTWEEEFVLPVVAATPASSDLVEILDHALECRADDCGYRFAGPTLGEPDFAPGD